jgi:hypothetical protein
MSNDNAFEMQIRARLSNPASADDIEAQYNRVPLEKGNPVVDDPNLQSMHDQSGIDEIIWNHFTELRNYGLVYTKNQQLTSRHMFVNMIRVFDSTRHELTNELTNEITEYALPLDHVYVHILLNNNNNPLYSGAIKEENVVSISRTKKIIMVSSKAIDNLVATLATDMNSMLSRRNAKTNTKDDTADEVDVIVDLSSGIHEDIDKKGQ